MNLNTEMNQKTIHHDYAGSLADAVVVAIKPAKPSDNQDQLEVNLANHIEAFCDCV